MQEAHKLIYNTENEDLAMSEYGRHIQRMVRFACEIKDPEKRQNVAETIIKLMAQVNPNNGRDDHQLKLWKHLLRISNYNLDVHLPEGVDPSPVDYKARASKLDYPDENKRYRHYGHFVQRLIDKAVDMKDDEKKQEFVQIIGSYMKQSYITFSQEREVSDDSIKTDLLLISKKKLKAPENMEFDEVKQPRKSNNNNSRRRSNRNSGRRRK